MAISVLKKIFNHPHYTYYTVDDDGIYAEFICDDGNDVQSLPTDYDETYGFKPRPGSTAVCCDDGTTYVLSPSGEWKEKV